MTRREFAGILAAATALQAQESGTRPRLLLTPHDTFSGLSILQARYAAGSRPPNDLPGWALSWRITGDASWARKALDEMETHHPPIDGKPSRTWRDYVSWSLAYDWLYDHPAFPQPLKDRIAAELLDAAAMVLALPDLRRADQVSYHNYSLRYLALASFALAAIENCPSTELRAKLLREQARAAFDNILELTNLVTPDGSYHESMDYMRITWVPLALLAELRRTTTGNDPARRYTVFRNFADTYLYKLLPNGTPSREGDNEYPILDDRDTAVLGYAVHRFKDPYAAWTLRRSRFLGNKWVLPILQFLWDDPLVDARDPALTTDHELPRQRYFGGVGHLVMRNGWKPDSTWIEFDCGPYFAKHQHLDQAQFTIYHQGYLAIDSGADYTDSESPHYLNYYRRTVAHNSMLIYDPSENFFWSENVLAAANDGGQRMDSSRFWNTVRSLEDWRKTQDLWNLASMRITDYEAGSYHYALGDATRAYSPAKLRRFTRELLYTPEQNVLFIFDRVVGTNASFRKTWLLHGVDEPRIDDKLFGFRDGQGEILVHSLLPLKSQIEAKGGPGNEFYSAGRNWPMEPAEGGPLPDNASEQLMWKTFWGADFHHIERSNRRNVVPGAWRVEVSPTIPAEEDFFLHVIEIGKPGKRIQLLEGTNVAGAIVDGGTIALFSTAGPALHEAEATVPEMNCNQLVISSLAADTLYELNLSGPNIASATSIAPGIPIRTITGRTNDKGILRLALASPGNVRLRLSKAH